MVLAERSNDAVRNGKRSRGPSPNGHGTHHGYSSSSEDENAEKIRVGRDYQAVCPELEAPDQRKPELLADRALLVWSPTIDISDSKLDEYITIAKEKYGYNGEQALGMLFWHKHDLNRASLDLANFTPFPDEWTVEDKVLFEQAFQFHGKSFHRIRQMLPDKSIASLVKYYYSWKKTRARTSLMDRGGPGSGGGSGSKRESDAGSDPGGSDKEISDTDKKENGGEGGKWCSVCGILCSTVMQHNSHKLCQACYAHARRTGNMRAVCGGPRRSGGPHKQRYKHRLPRGIYLNHDDLVAIATAAAAAAQTSTQPPPSHTHGDSILNAMDREIVSLKRQVQQNKQQLSAMKRKCPEGGVDELRPGEPPAKINARWTNDELLMAVTAVRKYGTDFQAIAETIGTKTEAHVRTFFISYRRRYNLDAVIKEHEAERATLSAQPQSQPQPGSTSAESEPASGAANGPKPETDATVSSKDEKPELDSEGVALGSEGEQGGVPTTPPKMKHK